MSTMYKVATGTFLAMSLILTALAILPLSAYAQLNLGSAEDLRCVQACAVAAAQNPPRPCPAPTVIPCKVSIAGGFGAGICQPIGCEAKSYGGGGGGAGGVGLDLVKQLLGGLMQQLMKGGQGGGSGSGSGGAPASTPTTNPGCKQYYQVNVPTTDPCAYYVPTVSSTLSGTGTTGTGVADQLLNALGGTVSNTNTNTNVSNTLNATTTAVTPSVVQANTATLQTGTTTIVNLLPGVRGDIQVLSNGATILAGTRDLSTNSEVAGFYGSNSFNSEPHGVIGQLCQTRPWASNFLSTIIPPTFFDGLCSLRGFQVGMPIIVKPTVTVVQTPAQPVKPKPAATSTTPLVAAKVSILAVPATVPLGSRTSVFWNTQGVTSCTETSPDGSFSQSSLSGGASTVALTGATTFTISCLGPDGSHVTDYVTVNLSI